MSIRKLQLREVARLSLGRSVVAALTGMAAFTAAAAGLSNSSTPLQFGLAAISALLSGGLAYWQADLLSQHRNSPGDNRAAHFPRTNLPTPLSSFVGRTGEIAVAERLLQEGRLVTLVGAGGCGKGGGPHVPAHWRPFPPRPLGLYSPAGWGTPGACSRGKQGTVRSLTAP